MKLGNFLINVSMLCQSKSNSIFPAEFSSLFGFLKFFLFFLDFTYRCRTKLFGFGTLNALVAFENLTFSNCLLSFGLPNDHADFLT